MCVTLDYGKGEYGPICKHCGNDENQTTKCWRCGCPLPEKPVPADPAHTGDTT